MVRFIYKLMSFYLLLICAVAFCAGDAKPIEIVSVTTYPHEEGFRNSVGDMVYVPKEDAFYACGSTVKDGNVKPGSFWLWKLGKDGSIASKFDIFSLDYYILSTNKMQILFHQDSIFEVMILEINRSIRVRYDIAENTSQLTDIPGDSVKSNLITHAINTEQGVTISCSNSAKAVLPLLAKNDSAGEVVWHREYGKDYGVIMSASDFFKNQILCAGIIFTGDVNKTFPPCGKVWISIINAENGDIVKEMLTDLSVCIGTLTFNPLIVSLTEERVLLLYRDNDISDNSKLFISIFDERLNTVVPAKQIYEGENDNLGLRYKTAVTDNGDFLIVMSSGNSNITVKKFSKDGKELSELVIKKKVNPEFAFYCNETAAYLLCTSLQADKRKFLYGTDLELIEISH